MQGSENDRDGIIGKVISNEPEIQRRRRNRLGEMIIKEGIHIVMKLKQIMSFIKRIQSSLITQMI